MEQIKIAARLEADNVLPLIEEHTCLLVEASCFNPPMESSTPCASASARAATSPCWLTPNATAT